MDNKDFFLKKPSNMSWRAWASFLSDVIKKIESERIKKGQKISFSLNPYGCSLKSLRDFLEDR